MTTFTSQDLKHVTTMVFYRYYKKYIEDYPGADCKDYFDDVLAIINDELSHAEKALADGTMDAEKYNLSKFLEK